MTSETSDAREQRLVATVKMFYRRLLVGSDPAKVQIRFDAAVLDRYVEQGLWVKRTNTVGRLKASTWSLDFGIGAGDATIHASAGDVASLPDKEREHWAAHVAQRDLSEAYLRALANPGSCMDDGDLRDWVGGN